jgi:hypothetical protein
MESVQKIMKQHQDKRKRAQMKIYRAEHREEARGPYTGPYSVREMEFAHDDIDHPSVDEDSVSIHAFASNHSIYVHGMPTKESLLEWFSGFYTLLYHNDFVLKTFEVPEPHFAVGTQVLFDPKFATLVNTEEFINFPDKESDIAK